MIKENLMNYLWFQRTVNYLWFQSTVKSLSFSRSLFVSVWVVTTHHLVPFLQSLMGRKPASPGYSQPVGICCPNYFWLKPANSRNLGRIRSECLRCLPFPVPSWSPRAALQMNLPP